MPPRVKDAALVVLVLANVVLLCTALAYVLHLPQADAQVAEPPAENVRFLGASGQIETGFLNVVYVLDTREQRLYSWTPNRVANSVNMVLRGWRDLRADFSKQPVPAVPPRR